MAQAKSHFKILVVGEIGAGKTTFINMLINLILGREYQDERVVAISQGFYLEGEELQPLECNINAYKQKQSDINGEQVTRSNESRGMDPRRRRRGKEKRKSRTQIPNMYTIEGDKVKFTLVDTPGFTEKSENIENFVMSVLDLTDFNAIVYVPGTEVTDNFASLFYLNELKGLLSTDCRDNFIVAFTSVQIKRISKRIDDTIQSLITRIGINVPVDNIIYFENECLIPMSLNSFIFEHEFEFRQSEMCWKHNQDNYKKMLECIKEEPPDIVLETLVKIAYEKQRQIEEIQIAKIKIEEMQNTNKKQAEELNNYTPDNLKEKIPVVVKLQRKIIRTKEIEDLVYTHNPFEVHRVVCKHRHSKLEMRTQEYEETVEDTETQWQTITNINKEAVKKQLEKNKKTLEDTIAEKTVTLIQMNDQIESDLKQMVYLQIKIHKPRRMPWWLEKDIPEKYLQKIRQRRMCPENDFTKEYLEKQIYAVRKNKLTDEQVVDYKKKYQELLDRYLYLKNLLEKDYPLNSCLLTEAEITQLDKRVDTVRTLLETVRTDKEACCCPKIFEFPKSSKWVFS